MTTPASTASAITDEQIDGLVKKRTAQDFAIEHAEYMAQRAEQLLEAAQEHAAAHMARDEDGNDPDSDEDYSSLQDRCTRADDALSEAAMHMRSGIYNFRERAKRTAAPTTQPAPAAPSKPASKRTESLRMPDGRCGLCGGEWCVCGCQGWADRQAASTKAAGGTT